MIGVLRLGCLFKIEHVTSSGFCYKERRRTWWPSFNSSWDQKWQPFRSLGSRKGSKNLWLFCLIKLSSCLLICLKSIISRISSMPFPDRMLTALSARARRLHDLLAKFSLPIGIGLSILFFSLSTALHFT
jgi:hypothetical protein